MINLLKLHKKAIIISLASLIGIVIIALFITTYVMHFHNISIASSENIYEPEPSMAMITTSNDLVSVAISSIEENPNEISQEQKLEDEEKDKEEEKKAEEEAKKAEEEKKKTSEQSKNVSNTPSYYIKVNRAANTVTIYTKDANGNYTVPVKAMVCSTRICFSYKWSLFLKKNWNMAYFIWRCIWTVLYTYNWRYIISLCTLFN